MLYKTVIGMMLVYGAAVWCLDPQLESKGNSTPSKDHSCLLLQGHTEEQQPPHSRSYLEFHFSTSSSSRKPESQPFEDSTSPFRTLYNSHFWRD
ncbi:hypothetical protein AVEN_97759-1 [Araneus ventricosus]|uniref:Uncharacterized protein n=1 Tax=Araneus ventricosus TaxID=182803 RepID=A0A4Y2E2I5_ARAVE|nr:hypothetical protein AVEN_97759-1 [Araneus ventricosus]